MQILFDIKEMKPGCALLQAAFRCSPGIASHFDSRHWIIEPTKNLKIYDITSDELKMLVEKVKNKHPLKPLSSLVKPGNPRRKSA